jgi:ribosomal-protein-alanine N-acetyltransferase
MIIETERTILREMTDEDLPALCTILQDPAVMYAYEHAFSDAEVREWLRKQQRRYREDGFGLWGVVEKTSGEMIGQCGLTMQAWGERQVVEVGYLFRKAVWHRGYATETAVACRDDAFRRLGAAEVFSIIRDSNFPSQRVALRNGMTVRGQFVKHYYGVDMPHLVFSITRAEWEAAHA